MDENKTKKKFVKGAAIGGAILSGLALTPVAIGFGSAGIAAGSFAAFIQSMIGNVTAGGVFATMTSFGMTGVYTTTAAASGTAAGGSVLIYLYKKIFGHDPEEDANKILEIINNRENPAKIIELIQYRNPFERFTIRLCYNNIDLNRDFDQDINNYVPQNQEQHMINLLRPTNNIIPRTTQIKNYLMNQTFVAHFMREYWYVIDARLINNVILFNDDPFIILRLIEYRSDDERVEIDKEFRKIREDPNKKMIFYIIDYIGNKHIEIPYLYALLEEVK